METVQENGRNAIGRLFREYFILSTTPHAIAVEDKDYEKKYARVEDEMLAAVSNTTSLEILEYIVRNSRTWYIRDDVFNALHTRIFELGNRTPEHLRRLASHIWYRNEQKEDPPEVASLRKEADEQEKHEMEKREGNSDLLNAFYDFLKVARAQKVLFEKDRHQFHKMTENLQNIFLQQLGESEELEVIKKIALMNESWFFKEKVYRAFVERISNIEGKSSEFLFRLATYLSQFGDRKNEIEISALRLEAKELEEKEIESLSD
jgi:hypothetical protein